MVKVNSCNLGKHTREIRFVFLKAQYLIMGSIFKITVLSLTGDYRASEQQNLDVNEGTWIPSLTASAFGGSQCERLGKQKKCIRALSCRDLGPGRQRDVKGRVWR